MRIANKGNIKLDRPAICAAIYLVALLPLFIFGLLESRVDSEGMGFIFLLAFTTPWSWLLMGLWNSPIWGTGPHSNFIAIFVTCNILSGAANSYLIYLYVNWRQKRTRSLKSRL